MEVIFDKDEIKNIPHRVGVTIGTFDGLHIGHQTVIRNLVDRCRKEGIKSVVYTFANIPREITEGKEVKKIITLDEKVRLISQLKVDYLILIEFTLEHMRLPAKKFIEGILLDPLDVVHLVVGHDFRFGKKAQGDHELLKKLQKKYGYRLDIVEPVTMDGKRISSTLIRELLTEGRILEANRYLGRHHYFRSVVTPGKRIGTGLGFPTANLIIDISMHTLKPGVYLTRVLARNKRYDAITNIGFNPTFERRELSFETYIIDFEGNLYGKELLVEFIDRIRDEAKFDSKEALTRRLKEDLHIARKYFAEEDRAKGFFL
jgi:riboflavin kinase/FMN adenylyltransferase